MNCITIARAAPVDNVPGTQRRKTMDKQLIRMPRWLSVDLAIIAVSVILIAAGVWIGFEGPPLPLLLSIAPQ